MKKRIFILKVLRYICIILLLLTILVIEIKKSKGETKVTGDEIYKYDLLNCEVKIIEEALNE